MLSQALALQRESLVRIETNQGGWSDWSASGKDTRHQPTQKASINQDKVKMTDNLGLDTISPSACNIRVPVDPGAYWAQCPCAKPCPCRSADRRGAPLPMRLPSAEGPGPGTRIPDRTAPSRSCGGPGAPASNATGPAWRYRPAACDPLAPSRRIASLRHPGWTEGDPESPFAGHRLLEGMTPAYPGHHLWRLVVEDRRGPSSCSRPWEARGLGEGQDTRGDAWPEAGCFTLIRIPDTQGRK